jgi:transposase
LRADGLRFFRHEVGCLLLRSRAAEPREETFATSSGRLRASLGICLPSAVLGYLHGIYPRMSHTRDLTEEQWKTLDPLIPKPGRRPDGRGRPWKSRRSVLNGILWVLRTGAPWADLPDRYPSFQTCHRRFQQWVRSGVMTRIMTDLAHELSFRGAIDVREAFIDASFAPAKKGDAKSEKRNVARERRSWQWQTVWAAGFCLRGECHPSRGDASCLHFATDGCSRCAAELDW